MFKLLVILAAFAFFGRSVKSLDSKYSLETRYIDVPLDHLATTTDKSFKLRFLITDKYHVKGGPVFIITGNECGDINKYAQNTGFLFDIAPIFNALLIFVEHRYYGQSLPFGNESFSSPENLRYLSTTQALADYAFVIYELKKTSYETNPFIAFGGSYGGMLAAWLRIKYPFLVIGAIASSAPIGIASCECIYKTVTKVFEHQGNQQCVNAIKLSWDVIINLSTTQLGMDFISSSWRLCERLTLFEDIENLLSWLSNIYVNLVLGNYHYPTDLFTPLPAYPVRAFCDKITTSYVNDTKGLIEQFGYALEIYTNYTGNKKCNNIKNAAEDFTEIAWEYQKCTEHIMPKCSTENDMFITGSWDYEQYAKECYEQYEVRSNPSWTEINYGGRNVWRDSNIVFGYAMMDPYSCGGVFSNLPASVYSFNITDAPHLLDLRSWDPADSDYVFEARKFYVQVLHEWLRRSIP